MKNHFRMLFASLWQTTPPLCLAAVLLPGCATHQEAAQHREAEAWFFCVAPEPHPVSEGGFTKSIFLMEEALRHHRLGQKQEANAFVTSAARLVAQRGESEIGVTCPEALEAAVTTSFGYLYEASALLGSNHKEQARRKAAQAWALLQPHLVRVLDEPWPPAARTALAWEEPAPRSICIALARVAGTLKESGDESSARVVSEWKFALCRLPSAKCAELYPEIVPVPANPALPLWVRGIAVPVPSPTPGAPYPTFAPPLSNPASTSPTR